MIRAIQHRAAVVKVMSVPDSRCVRVVVPDDHVSNGFHEFLIHDLEDEEPPCVAVSELGCLCLDWPRALFTFMERMQGAVWLHTVKGLYNLWQTHSSKSGQTCRLIPHGVSAAVAMSSDLVHGLERHSAGLCRSYEESP